MGIKSKIKTWFFLEDDYEEEYEEELSSPKKNYEPVKPSKLQQKQNVVSIQSVQKSSKLIILEPTVFSEVQEIADHLKSKKAVIVNLQETDRYEARRIIDFLSGTAYAIGGDIQRIGSDIFLFAPDNVEITGNVQDGFIYTNIEDTRW